MGRAQRIGFFSISGSVESGIEKTSGSGLGLGLGRSVEILDRFFLGSLFMLGYPGYVRVFRVELQNLCQTSAWFMKEIEQHWNYSNVFTQFISFPFFPYFF